MAAGHGAPALSASLKAAYQFHRTVGPMDERRFSRRRLLYGAVGAGLLLGGTRRVLTNGSSLLEDAAGLLDVDAPLRGRVWTLDDQSLGDSNYRGPNSLAPGTVQLRATAGGQRPRTRLPRTVPVDLRRQQIRLWFFVVPELAGGLRQVNVQVGSGDYAFAQYAYQSIQELTAPGRYGTEFIKPGQWTAITLGPASFASGGLGAVDFTAVQDFLVEISSWEGQAAEVLLGGMEVVPSSLAYPNGVVSFAFDDGLESAWSSARSVLSARRVPATAYVIRDLVGQSGYLTQAQIVELKKDGWEIAAHANTVRVHNAPGGFVGVSDGELIADWSDELAWLQREVHGDVVHVAYPQGMFDERVLKLLEQQRVYLTARTLNFRSIETLPPADPMRLRTVVYDDSVPLGDTSLVGSLFWRIDQVAQNGGWLILSFHDVSDGSRFGTNVTPDTLAVLVDRVLSAGLAIETVGGVWRRTAH